MNPTKILTVNPTINPSSVPPSMIPTTFLTVNPTKHSIITPTKKTSKKKPNTKKGLSTMPLIVPTKGPTKKKSKSKRTLVSYTAPTPAHCHWTRDVVQETLENAVEEEVTDDRIVKIE